jgi:hypothetical protein
MFHDCKILLLCGTPEENCQLLFDELNNFVQICRVEWLPFEHDGFVGLVVQAAMHVSTWLPHEVGLLIRHPNIEYEDQLRVWGSHVVGRHDMELEAYDVSS